MFHDIYNSQKNNIHFMVRIKTQPGVAGVIVN